MLRLCSPGWRLYNRGNVLLLGNDVDGEEQSCRDVGESSCRVRILIVLKKGAAKLWQ